MRQLWEVQRPVVEIWILVLPVLEALRRPPAFCLSRLCVCVCLCLLSPAGAGGSAALDVALPAHMLLSRVRAEASGDSTRVRVPDAAREFPSLSGFCLAASACLFVYFSRVRLSGALAGAGGGPLTRGPLRNPLSASARSASDAICARVWPTGSADADVSSAALPATARGE